LAERSKAIDEMGVGRVPVGVAGKVRVRSRIKIGPGGLIYVVVSGLILAAAVYTQANLLFWAFGLMVGGLIVSIAMAWQTLRGVRVDRLAPSHGVAGEPLVIRYRIENRSWLPAFGVVVAESWNKRNRATTGAPANSSGVLTSDRPRLRGRPVGWMLHIGPRQTLQAEAICWPLRRGVLRFENVRLWCSQPFGIIRREIEIAQPGEVLIFPHLYRMSRRLLFSLTSHDATATRQVEQAGGSEEFFGLRAYRAGDNVKHIDWKRTAKTRTMVVKEMTMPSPPRVMILIDLSNLDEVAQRVHTQARQETARAPLWKRPFQRQPDPDRPRLEPIGSTIERVMSLAASLVCDAHLHGFQIGVMTLGVPAATHPVHHSLAHRTRILESLARLDETKRSTREPNTHTPPSIVIVAGSPDRHSGGPAMHAAGAVLYADQISDYTHAQAADPESLLRREALPASRRLDMQREASARHADLDPQANEAPPTREPQEAS